MELSLRLLQHENLVYYKLFYEVVDHSGLQDEIGWTSRTHDMRNAYKIFVQKPMVKRSLGRLGVDGRIIMRGFVVNYFEIGGRVMFVLLRIFSRRERKNQFKTQ